MSRIKNKNKGHIISILAGICIGVALAETLRGGWKGWLLLAGTLAGRWLIGRIANTFFDDELEQAKRTFMPTDPVKRRIWEHRSKGHDGKFRDCREPVCNIW